MQQSSESTLRQFIQVSDRQGNLHLIKVDTIVGMTLTIDGLEIRMGSGHTVVVHSHNENVPGAFQLYRDLRDHIAGKTYDAFNKYQSNIDTGAIERVSGK